MKPSEHIDHLLQDLLDGELDAKTVVRAQVHMEHCERCRGEWAAACALAANVKALPRTIDPPRDLWKDISARLDEAPRANAWDADVSDSPGRRPNARQSPAREDDPSHPPARRDMHPSERGATLARPAAREDKPSHPSARRFRVRVGLAALIVAAAAAVVWILARGGGAGWGVETLEGAPLIARHLVGEQGLLRQGQWLETDDASRARLRVGSIGEVAVEPNTRIQLRRSSLKDHRIALAEGKIEARIWAPPRLFFVETPSATAVDLGCAYSLKVDETGKSEIHVTSGYVELQREGKSSIVPAGAKCYASTELGPGTVFSETAPTALQTALERYDFQGALEEDLDVILSEARPEDAMTLWQLVEQSDVDRREKIYGRLLELVHPPLGVTREGIKAGDSEMFEMWRLHLGLGAITWWGYLREKLSFPD